MTKQELDKAVALKKLQSAKDLLISVGELVFDVYNTMPDPDGTKPENQTPHGIMLEVTDKRDSLFSEIEEAIFILKRDL